MMFKRQIGSGLQVVWWCVPCGNAAYGSASCVDQEHLDPYAICRMPELAPAEVTTCKVCGEEGPVEVHHLAPKAVFGREEASRWPTVEVCHPCHTRWHSKMGTPGAREVDA